MSRLTWAFPFRFDQLFYTISSPPFSMPPNRLDKNSGFSQESFWYSEWKAVASGRAVGRGRAEPAGNRSCRSQLPEALFPRAAPRPPPAQKPSPDGRCPLPAQVLHLCWPGVTAVAPTLEPATAREGAVSGDDRPPARKLPRRGLRLKRKTEKLAQFSTCRSSLDWAKLRNPF